MVKKKCSTKMTQVPSYKSINLHADNTYEDDKVNKEVRLVMR